MNFTMNIPGLKDCIVTNIEERNEMVIIHIEMERVAQVCPSCGERTQRIHDYRLQKIKHLKWFERITQLWYKRRRYACTCGKRFTEKNEFIERYQRSSIEWNQAVTIRSIKGKTFKETAENYGSSATTIVRRFDKAAKTEIKEVKSLPSVIAIDEYKGDTTEGKYQFIIADAVTRKPLDVLPNRYKKTIKDYLKKHGQRVEVVIMDMSPSFKSAVQSALGKPVIVADRFHFCRYIYWALDRVRKRVQKGFSEYDRKKCKRMRHVFHKENKKLTDEQRWYLDRYLDMSEELCKAYHLKEAYKEWFENAKSIGEDNIMEVKEGLFSFYEMVEDAGIPEMKEAIKTFINWQIEVLNSFTYNYSNGFLEGINNTTKVLKRNAYGFRNFRRFRAKILLNRQYKGIGLQIG